MTRYCQEFPDIVVDRDYFPLKTGEEWGECLQSFLMLTNRGRQKGKTKRQIKESLSQEMADVFGFLLLFAEQEGIDLDKELTKKWTWKK
jgi:NTP pyrophosphatase (non-canonical NTP hydrolase)